MPDESPDRKPDAPARPGCNPLLFGVMAATIEMAVILWLLYGQ